MTPKVSCLNFGVQSLFDSKSSKVKKKLPKFLGAKCGQTTPIWWKIWGAKTPKISCTKLGMLLQNDARCQNWKNLPKFPGAKCGQTFPNWPLLFAILIGSTCLITILFIIWAGFLKCWVRGKNHIFIRLFCSKNHVFWS